MLKMSRWAIAVQVITICLFTQSQAHALTWFSFNGHEYALTSQWQSWDENQAEAVTHGGTLAVINSIQENDWLRDTFANTYQKDGPHNLGDPAWKSLVDIGYYKSNDGSWKWINGETGVDNPEQFYYFGSIGDGTKAYLHVGGHYYPGEWNSAPYVTDDVGYGYEPAFGVIEVSPIPEPETYAMLLAGLGLLGFMARRRKESIV